MNGSTWEIEVDVARIGQYKGHLQQLREDERRREESDNYRNKFKVLERFRKLTYKRGEMAVAVPLNGIVTLAQLGSSSIAWYMSTIGLWRTSRDERVHLLSFSICCEGENGALLQINDTNERLRHEHVREVSSGITLMIIRKHESKHEANMFLWEISSEADTSPTMKPQKIQMIFRFENFGTKEWVILFVGNLFYD